MKKIITFILILFTLILLYIFGKMFPDFCFESGKAAYDSGNYQQAHSYLKKGLMLSPNSLNLRLYYAKTLLKLSPSIEVQKELFALTTGKNQDAAHLIADMQISKWRNQILSNIGENYIDQVSLNNKILRWDTKKFPLNVVIENKSQTAPSYYPTEITRAFLQWQSVTDSMIRFKFDDKQKADILVQIIHYSDKNECNQDECKYELGYTTPIIKDNLLDYMEIKLYDSNVAGKSFSKEMIYSTAVHEIGHSLGIMGHSYNKNDVMYMESNPNNSLGKENNYSLLSNTDLNTLRLLYMLVPDISNTNVKDFVTSRQFYAPIVIGHESEINSKKKMEAENYIKMAPDLPNGYIDLSSAYAGEKQYLKAIEALDKALSLSENDDERFIIYYNFSIIYSEVKDWDNAIKYIMLAQQIKPSDELDGLIGSIKFKKGDITGAKESFELAVDKNPANILHSVNLARIYFKEFNFVQVGKVLNRLIEANPDAKNDGRVKVFGLFTLLFK